MSALIFQDSSGKAGISCLEYIFRLSVSEALSCTAPCHLEMEHHGKEHKAFKPEVVNWTLFPQILKAWVQAFSGAFVSWFMLVVLGLILSAHCKRATLYPPTSSCGAEAGIRKTAGTCKQREWGQTPGQRLPIGLGKHHSSLSSFVNQRTELLFGSFRDA